ncbi:MAG: hypothetical protein JOY58_12600 [Solirubrobacterales bacterium]|nr:hypothetical protein [Solirubrobacterales bacterium]
MKRQRWPAARCQQCPDCVIVQFAPDLLMGVIPSLTYHAIAWWRGPRTAAAVLAIKHETVINQ